MRIGIFTSVFERATLEERLEAVRTHRNAGERCRRLSAPHPDDTLPVREGDQRVVPVDFKFGSGLWYSR